MDKISVSVIIMTKNEEKNIEKCIRSLKDFAEIWVVDSNSTDNTVKIAKSLGAKIADFTWNGKYPKKKQWCLENIPFSYEWVLYVDADEEMIPDLAEEIKNELKNPKYDGYFIAFDQFFLGKRLKYGLKNEKLVLFKHRLARFLDYPDLDVKTMWEVEGHYQPHIKGTVGRFKNRMYHNDFKNLYLYFDRHNRYSDWEAKLSLKGALYNDKESLPLLRKIFKKIFYHLPFRPLFWFIYSYIFKLGFLDGKIGFHYHIFKTFYYWQFELKKLELRLRDGNC